MFASIAPSNSIFKPEISFADTANFSSTSYLNICNSCLAATLSFYSAESDELLEAIETL